MYYYIVYSSITYANRVKSQFENESGYIGVVHTPIGISVGGCSYSVKVKQDKLGRVLDVSNHFGFKIKGVFQEHADNTFTEVAV